MNVDPGRLQRCAVAYFVIVLVLLYGDRFRVHPAALDYGRGISLLTLFNLCVLPPLGLFVWARGPRIRLPYAPAMLCILLASSVAASQAQQPLMSIYHIGFEAYCYAWFVIMVALFALLGKNAQRLVMRVWVALAVLNGCFIVAQFVSIELREVMAADLPRRGSGLPRPMGLMGNSNLSAFAQLSAMLAILRASLPRRLSAAAGLFICATIVPTGSVSTLLALGLALATFAIWLAAKGTGAQRRGMARMLAIGALLIAGFLRLVIQYHATFAVNSFAHLIGSQPYTDQNSARDSAVTAILTLGEGYHNFHHRFQADYRNGVRWFQLDPTKWFVWSLSKVGVTRDLRRVSAVRIREARERMRQAG